MDYKEKLKAPRWINRRREIMERDNHKCMICGVDNTRLNVHHLHYKRDAEPWEYDYSELATLCEDCRGAETGEDVLNNDANAIYLSL